MSDTGPDRGIVFAATGPGYVALARRAARTVRLLMPDIAIDLFTDAQLDDPVFDRVHLLDSATTRPKMAALRASRFDKTLYLDCDVIVLVALDDVLDLLQRADIVGAHEQYGSSSIAMMQTAGPPVPPAFRQMNGGVLGVRRSLATQAFLAAWQTAFEASPLRRDQPALRDLLRDSDLRVMILPQEYNMMHMPYLMAANEQMMAPRILHLPHLHLGDRFTADPATPLTPAEILSDAEVARIDALLASDRTLGARPTARTYAKEMLRRAPALDRAVRSIWWRFR